MCCASSRPSTRPWRFNSTNTTILYAVLFLSSVASALNHMDFRPPDILDKRQVRSTPLVIRNECESTIWPGMLTQHGNGPPTNGFELASGSQRSFTVAENWQGRVWGRTNCSFNGGGQTSKPCGTGDCGTTLSCIGTGEVPTTLAEFTLDAGDGHTYYDISLVDGYNLPMAIQMLPESNGSFQQIPQRLTNPSCIGTVGEAKPSGYNVYNDRSPFLGTTAQHPLPFENDESLSDIAQWCPWGLQQSTSNGPNGGVYTYPDGSPNRPAFDPCYSACARYNQPSDCCTGQYNSPSACSPSQYSRNAKAVCPDAYSYAFDDQTSTFIIPSGAGFEVIFCPGARSTDIIATSKGELNQLAQTGHTSSTQKKLKRQRQYPELYYITSVHHNDTMLALERPEQENGNSSEKAAETSILALIIALAVLVAFYGNVILP